MASLTGKGKSSSSNENMQQRSSACSSSPESDDDTSHPLPPVHGYCLFFSYTSHTRPLSLSLSLSESLFHSFIHIYMHKHSKKYMNKQALYAETYRGESAKAGRVEEVIIGGRVRISYHIDDSLFGNCSGSLRQVFLSFQTLFKSNGADYTVVLLCGIGCRDSVQTR